MSFLFGRISFFIVFCCLLNNTLNWKRDYLLGEIDFSQKPRYIFQDKIKINYFLLLGELENERIFFMCTEIYICDRIFLFFLSLQVWNFFLFILFMQLNFVWCIFIKLSYVHNSKVDFSRTFIINFYEICKAEVHIFGLKVITTF